MGDARDRVRCAECGSWSVTIYCGDCVTKGVAKCPHNNEASECDACFTKSDQAFDEQRER